MQNVTYTKCTIQNVTMQNVLYKMLLCKMYYTKCYCAKCTIHYVTDPRVELKIKRQIGERLNRSNFNKNVLFGCFRTNAGVRQEGYKAKGTFGRGFWTISRFQVGIRNL